MPVFRKLTEDDVEKIVAMEKETFSQPWSEDAIRSTMKLNYAVIHVAEVEGEFAGYCIVYCVLDEGEIARIAVNPSMRRKGVGRGLLDYTCKWCEEKRIASLFLEVRESNEGARAFYKQYGFAEDGVRKNYYDMPKEHAILMSLAI